MTDTGLLPSLVFFFVSALAGSFAVFLTWKHRSTFRFQVTLFLVAFAVRFAFSIWVYQFGLVRVLGDEDSSGWVLGVPLQQQWISQRLPLIDLPYALAGAFRTQHAGYRYLAASLFFLTGSPTRMMAAVLNCFIGALTVVFAYRIARTIFSEWVADRVGWWTCLMPSLIVWSAQTVKEPVVIFLETVALYGCVTLKRDGFSMRHVILCAATAVLVIPFRFYVAYIVSVAILLALIFPHVGRRRVSIGSALLVTLVLVPLLLVSGVLIRHEAQFEKFDTKFIQTYRHGLAVGSGSGVETHYDLNSRQGFAMATIVGGVHLLLAPFPWQLGGSLRKILTTPEVFIWWILFFVGVVPGLLYTLRRRFSDVLPLLFFVVGLGLLYAVTFGNVGLAYRQRAQLLPWLLVFAMVGLEQKMLKKRAQQEWLWRQRVRSAQLYAGVETSRKIS